MRIHQYNKNRPCYYCGAAPPSGKEHVPAKMLLEGHDCDHFTVPACSEHNTNKSGEDQAIISALSRSMDQVHSQMSHAEVPVAVQRSIVENRTSYERVKRHVELRKLVDHRLPGISTELPYIDASRNTFRWFAKLTAGLCWAIQGRYDPLCEWTLAETWSPTFFKTGDETMDLKDFVNRLAEKLYVDRLILQSGQWRSGWQPRGKPYLPEIYEFMVCVEAAPRSGPPRVNVRHRLLSSHIFVTTFVASADLIQLIEELPGTEPPAPFLGMARNDRNRRETQPLRFLRERLPG